MNEAQTLTAKFFRLRAISDTAFKAGDGALSVGTAHAACLVAVQFQRLKNLDSTDKAVEEMRRLRRLVKDSV